MASKNKAKSSTADRILKMLSLANKMADTQDHERGIYCLLLHILAADSVTWILPGLISVLNLPTWNLSSVSTPNTGWRNLLHLTWYSCFLTALASQESLCKHNHYIGPSEHPKHFRINTLVYLWTHPRGTELLLIPTHSTLQHSYHHPHSKPSLPPPTHTSHTSSHPHTEQHPSPHPHLTYSTASLTPTQHSISLPTHTQHSIPHRQTRGAKQKDTAQLSPGQHIVGQSRGGPHFLYHVVWHSVTIAIHQDLQYTIRSLLKHHYRWFSSYVTVLFLCHVLNGVFVQAGIRGDQSVGVISEGGLLEAILLAINTEARLKGTEDRHPGLVCEASLHYAVVTRPAPHVVVVIEGIHMMGIEQEAVCTWGMQHQWK
ncbi:hypothetical protein E2C01_006944 [Portunus trituberculatus]|uniref:Uncharacterized protein n=1 Tax=Portunus trituberculatus TaxID=210409 RepID=A0A5B7CYP1_PORTR|nr:hypothetical protein [Portunus trituberculatus]